MVETPELEMIPVINSQRSGVRAKDAVENLLLSLVDGKMTIAQLGESCGLEAGITQRIVAKLQNDGLVQIKGLAAAQPVAGEKAQQQSSPVAGGAVSMSASQGEFAADEIEKLHQQFENYNYYKVLGVSPLAARTEIRAAYFALSKKYHPDTRSRNVDAQVKKKLSRIFDKITTAYDVLSGKSRREKYDATISDEIEMWKMEHQLKQAVEQRPSRAPGEGSVDETSGGTASAANVSAIDASAAKEPPPEEPLTKAPGGASQSAAAGKRPPPSSGDRSTYRRAPVQDNVSIGMGARISRIPVTRTSCSVAEQSGAPQGGTGKRSSSAESELRRQQWKRDRMKRALGSTTSPPIGHSAVSSTTSSSTGGQSDAYLLEHAQLAIEKHEFDLAVQYLQELLRRDGENSAASMLLYRAQSGKVKSNVNDLIRQGRFQQSKGNLQEALELYERALKLDNRFVEAKHHVANALLESRKDLPRALQLSREVVGMGGNKASYYATFAELLELANESGRAVEAMQRAVRLSPDNRDFKKRLKTMKK